MKKSGKQVRKRTRIQQMLGKPERTKVDVGIRRFLLWIWMVVDISHLHDHHDCALLFYDATRHGVHDVWSIFPYGWRPVLEGTLGIGK